MRTLTRPAPRTPATADGRRVHLLTTPEALADRAADWERDLPAGPLGPLLRPAWFVAAARTLAPAGALRVVLVEEHGRVIAVAPLVALPSGRLELLGARELPEPGDLVARDADALATLARAVVALRRPVGLARVPADSPTPAALRRAAAARGGWVGTRPAESWPTLWLDDGWAAPEGRLSARRAGDLRRARRRAEATGAVALRHHAPDVASADALLQRAMDVEAAGWKGRAGTALAQDPVRRPFFAAWAREAARDGSLRIAFLTIDGVPVASQVSAESAERRWIIKIGHDDAYARCSPGLLLLLETVRDAAARGLQAVELLGTVEPWTQAWTTHESPARLVRAYPPNPAGARRLAIDGGRAVLARTRRRPTEESSA